MMAAEVQRYIRLSSAWRTRGWATDGERISGSSTNHPMYSTVVM